MKITLVCDRCYNKLEINSKYIKAVVNMKHGLFKIFLDKNYSKMGPGVYVGQDIRCHCFGRGDKAFNECSRFRVSKEDKAKLVAVMV